MPRFTLSKPAYDFDNDVLLANGPEDSVTRLAWSPKTSHLAISSWDAHVRIYDVTSNPAGEIKKIFQAGGPTLSCDWSKDGSKVLCSSADKTAHLLDLNQDGDRLAGQQIAVHDSAISSIRFVTTPAAGAEIAVTASWDRKLRYWDLRSSNPLGELDLSERIYAMDTAENLLVAGTADNKLHFIDLTKPMEIARTVDAELKKEITAPGIRDIACRKDGKSCFVATVEGRILERFANPANKADNWGWRPQGSASPTDPRTMMRFPVNAVSCYPVHYEIVATAGADGQVQTWDAANRNKVFSYRPKASTGTQSTNAALNSNLGSILNGLSSSSHSASTPRVSSPLAGRSSNSTTVPAGTKDTITSVSFNNDGKILAYAVGYDWSKGFAGRNGQNKQGVFLHGIKDGECDPKPKF